MAVTVARISAGTLGPGLSRRGTGGSTGRNKLNPVISHCEEPSAHSTGTTISFARTMFRRLRTADSIVRGSELSCSISTFNDWFVLRSPATSVCIRTYCSDAIAIRLCVLIDTVAQIAAPATIIMPKITQAGTTPPRRLTSAEVPISSCEISRTDEKGVVARGATLCARIRSSTQ